MDIKDDGSFVFPAIEGYGVSKIDANTVSESDSFQGHDTGALSVGVDDTHGYSGGKNDDTVRKWKTSDMSEVDTFTKHGNGIKTIYLDGNYGYSGDRAGFVRKWDKSTLTQQESNQPNTNIIRDIHVDDTHLFKVGTDNDIEKLSKSDLSFDTFTSLSYTPSAGKADWMASRSVVSVLSM